MITNPMLYITAGLMTLSVSSVHSGIDFDAAASRVTIPRWLPARYWRSPVSHRP